MPVNPILAFFYGGSDEVEGFFVCTKCDRTSSFARQVDSDKTYKWKCSHCDHENSVEYE